jgi:hypothetical protein
MLPAAALTLDAPYRGTRIKKSCGSEGGLGRQILVRSDGASTVPEE